jgi:hypothetical protein
MLTPEEIKATDEYYDLEACVGELLDQVERLYMLATEKRMYLGPDIPDWKDEDIHGIDRVRFNHMIAVMKKVWAATHRTAASLGAVDPLFKED